MKQIVRHICTCWKTAESDGTNFVHTKLNIAILKASHQYLRGPRIPTYMGGFRIGQDGSSLGSFRTSEF